MTQNPVKNLEAARTALLDVVKTLPQQLTELPAKLRASLPKTPAAVQERIDQVKVFAPIDLDGLQEKARELQGRLVDLPALVSSFVSDLADRVTSKGSGAKKPSKKPASKNATVKTGLKTDVNGATSQPTL